MGESFFKLSEQKAGELFPGVTRRILARGGKLMAMQAVLTAGAEAPPHSHIHEQVSYVVSGRLRATVAGRTELLATGDSFFVPSGAEHRVEALEASVVLDVFTPQREDLLR